MNLRKSVVSMLVVTATLLATALPHAVEAQTRIASWNIRNLGWDNGKDYAALAEVGSRFSFIAVQEVMNEDGIARFRSALDTRTGESWEQLCSHLVGRGSYREMYCFVWRPSQITWIGGAAVYLDDRDVFAREPFSAEFTTLGGFGFVATSIHAIYGDNVAGRMAEAEALLSYRQWLDANHPGIPVFLMGDFNLAPTNPAWNSLRQLAVPLITEGATTISTIDGRFANLYDNIWAPLGHDLPIVAAGRLEFPHQILGITHEDARARVSDHIPVWMEIDDSAVQSRMPVAQPPVVPAPTPPAASAPHQTAPAPDRVTIIIGNRNSNIYHLPGCSSYGQVGAANQVHFADESAAQEAGYRKARNC